VSVLTHTHTWLVATPHPSHGRVTIADVAREAGVNKGTVSRALRGVSGVGPGTRARILDAADRLDFSASHIATALATGQSQTVGIVLPTLRSWYFSEVASGASEVLTPAGFRVELISLDIDSDFLDVESGPFRSLLRELGAGRARDALLFAGNISVDADPDAGGTAHFPVSASGLPITQVPGIYIDHRAGGRMVGEHLVGLGHRRLAVLDGRMPSKPDAKVWQQRTDGFREAVARTGSRLPPEAVLVPGDSRPEHGEWAAEQLLARDEMPTAVFCHADEMAFGAIAAFRRAGLRCPEDISVAGFDGHPMARLWELTTVDQHAHQQGARGARALIAALRHQDPAQIDEPSITVSFVQRGTTGPPPPADRAIY
jgi:DNA-binding LacI/PurR family transcriptional regulator